MLSIIIFIIGAIFWILTYIVAPMESKKSGHNVSGFPGMSFICFGIGGLISPYKRLALLCLLDISVVILPFFLLKNARNNKSD